MLSPWGHDAPVAPRPPSPRPTHAGSCGHCPYPTGQATNIVPGGPRGSSEKEIDWVLVSPDTAVVSANRVLLPGLCTHLALMVDLELSIAALRPIDPCGRRFRFERARADDLHLAGQLFSLVSWWGIVGGADPDAIIRMGLHHGTSPPPLSAPGPALAR